MTDEAVHITDNEAKVLAQRIAAQRVANPEDWVIWEEYPRLDQVCLEQLQGEVARLASIMAGACRAYDRTYGIDTAELLERIKG